MDMKEQPRPVLFLHGVGVAGRLSSASRPPVRLPSWLSIDCKKIELVRPKVSTSRDNSKMKLDKGGRGFSGSYVFDKQSQYSDNCKVVGSTG